MPEPPPYVQLQYTYPAVREFLDRVVPLLHQGVTPTSWYRSPSHNRSVGGSPDSQHQIGTGLDVTGSRYALQDFAFAARSSGLIAVDEGHHVHVQLFPAGWLRQHGYEWLFRLA